MNQIQDENLIPNTKQEATHCCAQPSFDLGKAYPMQPKDGSHLHGLSPEVSVRCYNDRSLTYKRIASFHQAQEDTWQSSMEDRFPGIFTDVFSLFS